MIEVKVAQEKKYRIRIRQDPVQFRETVSGIEHDVVLLGGDENGDGVACLGVVPAVCPEKSDLHGLSFLVNRSLFRKNPYSSWVDSLKQDLIGLGAAGGEDDASSKADFLLECHFSASHSHPGLSDFPDAVHDLPERLAESRWP